MLLLIKNLTLYFTLNDLGGKGLERTKIMISKYYIETNSYLLQKKRPASAGLDLSKKERLVKCAGQ